MSNTIKISPETMSLLSSFGAVSNSIIITAGEKRLTIANADNSAIAYANIKEVFPVTFGIYDLNQFLSVQSLVKDADFIFDEHSVTIVNNSNSLVYRYSVVDYIHKAPPRVLFPYDHEGNVKFSLVESTKNDIKLASDKLKFNTLSFTSKKGSPAIYATAYDTSCNNDVDNSFSTLVSNNDDIIDQEFSHSIDPKLIKGLVKGDYTVTLCPKGAAEFAAPGILYYISLEKRKTR